MNNCNKVAGGAFSIQVPILWYSRSDTRDFKQMTSNCATNVRIHFVVVVCREFPSLNNTIRVYVQRAIRRSLLKVSIVWLAKKQIHHHVIINLKVVSEVSTTTGSTVDFFHDVCVYFVTRETHWFLPEVKRSKIGKVFDNQSRRFRNSVRRPKRTQITRLFNI